MLEWLFGSYTTPILIALAIIAVVFFIIKFPNGKIFIYTILGVCLLGTAIYSGINIYKYHTVGGGVFGSIEEIESPNQVFQNKTTFEFKNIMLTQSDGDLYEARFETDSVVKLSAEERYKITVNNLPCKYLIHSNDYVVCEYKYNFYDEDFNSILEEPDTIQFKIAFYEKYTYLVVSSQGGSKAVDCWNDYFNKNDFVLKIEASSNVYIPQAEYNTITLHIDDGITQEVEVLNGYTFELPEIESPDTRRFLGWSTDNENVLDMTNITVTDDMTFYALYDITRFKVNYYNQEGTEVIKVIFYEEGENDLNYSVMPSDVGLDNSGTSFCFWTVEQTEVIGMGDNLSDYIKIETIEQLKMMYPDSQEFNLYPLIYSMY